MNNIKSVHIEGQSVVVKLTNGATVDLSFNNGYDPKNWRAAYVHAHFSGIDGQIAVKQETADNVNIHYNFTSEGN